MINRSFQNYYTDLKMQNYVADYSEQKKFLITLRFFFLFWRSMGYR